MNKEKFLSFYPGNLNAEKMWDSVVKAYQDYGVEINPLLMVGTMATIRTESGRTFELKRENLNYSAKGLLATFPRYFNYQTAQQYAYHSDKIANHVYANRMGNGDEASGDGWRNRGAGPIQLTGKDNWLAVGMTDENCLTPEMGGKSVAYYFKTNHVIEACLAKDWKRVRILVNGGLNGWEDTPGNKGMKSIINDYLK
jgi:putative chitinase